MDGARWFMGSMSEKQPQILRLAVLAQDDRFKEQYCGKTLSSFLISDPCYLIPGPLAPSAFPAAAGAAAWLELIMLVSSRKAMRTSKSTVSSVFGLGFAQVAFGLFGQHSQQINGGRAPRISTLGRCPLACPRPFESLRRRKIAAPNARR